MRILLQLQMYFRRLSLAMTRLYYSTPLDTLLNTLDTLPAAPAGMHPWQASKASKSRSHHAIARRIVMWIA